MSTTKRSGNMPIGLITGASRGLGFALSNELTARGWELIVDARDASALGAAETRMARASRVVAIPGDVSDPAHRDELADAVREMGGLDLLVNNASTLGTTPLPPLAGYPLDDLEQVLQINLLAPLALTQALLPSLVARQGTVVNITSDAAVEAYEGWGGYGSSKAALDQITAVLAAEQPALHVYAFDPGDMRTQMHQNAFPGEDISDRPLPEQVVPSLLRLIDEHPKSGRYRAGELPALAESSTP
jgi:NAD(P)-dependent dehydrogenase (short-subunit alcohol dehydrogenase family)